jgi:hypothetical protein
MTTCLKSIFSTDIVGPLTNGVGYKGNVNYGMFIGMYILATSCLMIGPVCTAKICERRTFDFEELGRSSRSDWTISNKIVLILL